jgi:hypothetical protein
VNNAETELTKYIRTLLEARGCHFIKLSDRFTRGVLDSLVVSDRIVWVEYKVHRTGQVVQTYQQLGLSGVQDHHIRQTARRSRRAACCTTGLADGRDLALWTPVSPESELVPNYRLAADGEGQVLNWLLGDLA